jgi:SAM-dependent methyltransferase
MDTLLQNFGDDQNYQHLKINKQRLECVICHYSVKPNEQAASIKFPCNVRAFKHETFEVWRCPNCQTIHCLDVVDLEKYYAKYPFAEAKLTLPFRLYYQKICRQLTKYGLSQTDVVLDYGCGNGQFVQYLREQGFSNSYGYDPYASKDGFGNPSILQKAPFNYILLQDVIEHVEEPNILLSELNSLLAPGGYIIIGTPNAANIDLSHPSLSDYYNPIHVPYHLHIYTRETLESLGNSQGWTPLEFWPRSYSDTRWFGLNARAWNEYQRISDGTLDALFEPIKVGKALTSYKFLLYAIFGYWLGLYTEITIIFQKNISSS